jgi:hypothetical protein
MTSPETSANARLLGSAVSAYDSASHSGSHSGARAHVERSLGGRVEPLAEEFLLQAAQASCPAERIRLASRGLSSRAALDADTQALLLHQLHLGHFEVREFTRAAEVAEQQVATGAMLEVAHHDAARSKRALGQVGESVAHLRLAARAAPPHRQAFHHWTLGSVLFVEGRLADAAASLARAARWGTADKPLYEAHLALALHAAGSGPIPQGAAAQGAALRELGALADALAGSACRKGYGRFVLGLLAREVGSEREAAAHLRAFVRRTRGARPVAAIALEPEVAYAERALAELSRAPAPT